MLYTSEAENAGKEWQTFEFKGFSSAEDCKKASKAASEIFMLGSDIADVILSECKEG